MPSAADIFKDKIKHLTDSEAALVKAVIKYQADVYELIASEYLPQFDTENGVLLDTPKNANLIAQIDVYFDKLEKVVARDVLSPMVKNILDTVSLNAEYYIALGFKKTVVDTLFKDKFNLEAKLGITPTGRLNKNGYLYKLGQTQQVRQELKDYVIKSLTGDVPFLEFQLGFRNLVIGNKRVKGLNVDGSLKRYFDQYAIDAFSQTDAITNKQAANELQLDHFIYEGSIIKTTRPFCAKRAGKAFSVKETKNWKNDPDLVDKKTKDSYRPLVERGRYRCRHAIRYITKALYEELTGQKAKE